MYQETRKNIKKHKLEMPVQYNHKTIRIRADISTEAPKIRKTLEKNAFYLSCTIITNTDCYIQVRYPS